MHSGRILAAKLARWVKSKENPGWLNQKDDDVAPKDDDVKRAVNGGLEGATTRTN
jgi:hypothetical protein